MQAQEKFTKSHLVELVKDVASNLKPTPEGIALKESQLQKLEKNIETLYYIAFPIVNRTSFDTETDYSEARAALRYSAISYLEARIIGTITSLYMDKPLLRSRTLTKEQINKMKVRKTNLTIFSKILKYT